MLYIITINKEKYERHTANDVYDLVDDMFPNHRTKDGIPMSVEVQTWAELAGPGEEFDNDFVNIKIKD